MQEGEHLFMHGAQAHKAFTLCTGAIILIFFTPPKLLNDSKALLSTPQQNTTPIKRLN